MVTTAKQNRRSVNGILVLDKEHGISSNRALQQVKHLYAARKAGHTGSLDPIATGMLVICFGHATKFSQFLLEADKSYRVTAKLGVTTTTADTEGEVISEKPVVTLNEEILEKILQQFRGSISQIPPMYSALKHQGQPLYKLARQGIEVERKPRTVNIYALSLERYSQDELQLHVRCSKGTYIRTLVEDIGEQLGCGAHVTELRRLDVGGFTEQAMLTREQLELLCEQQDLAGIDQQLLPISSISAHMPKVEVAANSAFFLKQGQSIAIENMPNSGLVGIYGEDQRFLGVGEMTAEGRVIPRRILAENG